LILVFTTAIQASTLISAKKVAERIEAVNVPI